MMWPVLLLLALAVADGARTRQYREKEASFIELEPEASFIEVVDAKEVAGEPKWCKNEEVKPPCTDVQERFCPITCLVLVAGHDEDMETVTGEPTTLIPITAVTTSTPQRELLRIANSPAYLNLWPKTCDGLNAKGEKLHLQSTNGFACLVNYDGSSSVAAVSSNRWTSTDHVCCAGHCQETKDCGMKHLSLAAASKEVVSAVMELKTKSGKMVSVHNSETSSTEPGVLSVSEIRMDGDVLTFQPAKVDLTTAGSEFLDELTYPLSAYLSMQLSGFASEGQEVRIVICAHGSSTASPHNVKPGLEHIPDGRAQTIADKLSTALAASEAVTFGKANGHFRWEYNLKHGSVFPGGRFGSILVKLYLASAKVPECTSDDLYEFVELEKEPEPEKQKEKAQCDNPTDLPLEDGKTLEEIGGSKEAIPAPPDTVMDDGSPSLDLNTLYYLEDEKIYWTCPKGYNRFGARSSTCMANGEWDAPRAVCAPKFHCFEGCQKCASPEKREGKNRDCRGCPENQDLIYTFVAGQKGMDPMSKKIEKEWCAIPQEVYSGWWRLDPEKMDSFQNKDTSAQWLGDRAIGLSWDSDSGSLSFLSYKWDPSKGWKRKMEEPVVLKCEPNYPIILSCAADYTYMSKAGLTKTATPVERHIALDFVRMPSTAKEQQAGDILPGRRIIAADYARNSDEHAAERQSVVVMRIQPGTLKNAGDDLPGWYLGKNISVFMSKN